MANVHFQDAKLAINTKDIGGREGRRDVGRFRVLKIVDEVVG